MKLLHEDGAPVGITFKKHGQNSGYVLRVTGNRQTTDIGADANNLPECYEKAVDKRLELLNIQDDAEAWQSLASAYNAFLVRSNVVLVPVTHLEFQILKGFNNETD